MHRDWTVQIGDILESIQKIQEYTSNLKKAEFLEDGKTQDAVIRNLAVIGEASRLLPEEIKNKAPSVEWKKIISFRNILIHEYFGISTEIVWDIIENKLSDLKMACDNILEGNHH